jgi:hypothetical protein
MTRDLLQEWLMEMLSFASGCLSIEDTSTLLAVLLVTLSKYQRHFNSGITNHVAMRSGVGAGYSSSKGLYCLYFVCFIVSEFCEKNVTQVLRRFQLPCGGGGVKWPRLFFD